jgi:hypothetical protein
MPGLGGTGIGEQLVLPGGGGGGGGGGGNAAFSNTLQSEVDITSASFQTVLGPYTPAAGNWIVLAQFGFLNNGSTTETDVAIVDGGGGVHAIMAQSGDGSSIWISGRSLHALITADGATTYSLEALCGDANHPRFFPQNASQYQVTRLTFIPTT